MLELAKISTVDFLIMNSLELQEKTIYTHLMPFLSEQGFQMVNPQPGIGGGERWGIAVHGIAAPGKEFRKSTPGGFKSVMFSFGSNEGEQVLNVHLGLRFNIVESLVSQFLREDGDHPEGQHTIVASLHRFNHPPLPKLVLTDESSLQLACKQIREFMQKKGFRFLNTFDKLKRIDACLNREPFLPSPYIQNQIHRCFKAIIMARLLQRTNFEALCAVYQNSLQNQKTSEKVLENYQKLVTYLRYFSFN